MACKFAYTAVKSRRIEKTPRFHSPNLFYPFHITRLPQDLLPELLAVLKKSSSEDIEHVFDELRETLDKLPYDQAVVYEDALLHTAAVLLHCRQALGN